jgi:hypothetical protein
MPGKKRKTIAMITLETGPASAVMAIPFFGFLKRFILTGTGFAQPKRKNTIIKRPIISI